jgi:hypothetical protein
MFHSIQYINKQNSSSKIQENAKYNIQFMLSANSYMFWHQSAILKEFNEPFVAIKWARVAQSV